MCACVQQVILAANAEVARGMKSPLYKLWQKLPGTSNTGQAAIKTFQSTMNDLLQEVILLPCCILQNMFVCTYAAAFC